MDEGSKRVSLVDLYLTLKRETGAEPEPEAGRGEPGPNLDILYRRIVTEPARDCGGIVDKLRFARHCLDEEHDFKEAANLIEEVACTLQRAQVDPT